MKKLIFSLAVLFLFSATAFSQKIIKTQRKGQALKVRMQIDELEREFIIHFPKGYKKTDRKVPAVFMFHGSGGNGERFYKMSGWKELGNKEGFLSIYPSALNTCIIKDGKPASKTYWMTPQKLATLCKGETPRDDTRFVRAIIKYIIKKYRADKKRIYASGFSNGMGFTMSQCVGALSKHFAAVGGAGSLFRDSIPFKEPLPSYVMLGSLDDRFTVHNNNQPLPMNPNDIASNAFLQPIISGMATALSLKGKPSIKQGAKYTKLHYTKQTKPGPQELHFAMLKDVKHNWPNGKAKVFGINAPEILWRFFKKHSK